MTFAEQLQRYETWLQSLDDAPAWRRVAFVSPADLSRSPSPAEIPRDQLLSPGQFEAVFDGYMDGRYAWINLECLGVIDDTLFVTHFVSSGGPAAKASIPRDRVAVNFSGPDKRCGWDAARRIRVI